MKNFIIEYNPTIEDLKQMIMLDNEAYAEENDCGVLEKCLQWQKKCPDLYTVIKANNKVIGYINFISLTLDAYNRFRAGKLKDYELTLSDILPFSKGKNYCLFMSVVIKKDYRDSAVIIHLMNALYKKIEKFKADGIFIERVVADCVSVGGERLATILTKRFNAKYLCDTENNSKIYEFNFN